MSATAKLHAWKILWGLVLGFSLVRIGFADYRELHAMFTFQDLRLFLTFMGAVGVTAGLRYAFGIRREFPRAMNPGVIVGGVIFGVGWVLCGACPGIAFAQLGTMDLTAVVTLTGILVGTWVYPRVHVRFFKWDAGVCET
jgi:uncharacterized membrane protein YedE/YeeE